MNRPDDCEGVLQAAQPAVGNADRRAYLWLATVAAGYIGVYLCRKNLAVAIPMLELHFQASREQVGMIASLGTVSYAAGKFLFGPVIDRLGGRFCLFTSLVLVVLFGAAGGLASSIPVLAALYSCNRLAGSAGWGSMMKLLPGWFPPRQLAFASALLSLSFVFGGVCATLLAGQIAAGVARRGGFELAGGCRPCHSGLFG